MHYNFLNLWFNETKFSGLLLKQHKVLPYYYYLIQKELLYLDKIKGCSLNIYIPYAVFVLYSMLRPEPD